MVSYLSDNLPYSFQFGIIDSDCQIYFYEYIITLKLKHTFDFPVVQKLIRYLKNHKTWLVFGQDHVIREFDMTKPEGSNLILTIEGHTTELMDVIELENPFAVATASMDTTIRIYSLVDKKEVSVYREHRKGVRCLTYNPNFGGVLVSAGYERNMCVWCPEVALNKSLIGKLEG